MHLKTVQKNLISTKKSSSALKIQEYFNILKLHTILHYINAICTLGFTDAYNLESPEHLHIDFAKEAY